MSRLARTILTVAAASFAVAAVPAASASAACVDPHPPYRHIRITGQKAVYAHAYASCATSSALTVKATIYKWNGSAWGKYSSTASSSNDAFAYEFLCNNYGWGGSGSGYFATWGTATWNTPAGPRSEGRWSGSRQLSC